MADEDLPSWLQPLKRNRKYLNWAGNFLFVVGLPFAFIESTKGYGYPAFELGVVIMDMGGGFKIYKHKICFYTFWTFLFLAITVNILRLLYFAASDDHQLSSLLGVPGAILLLSERTAYYAAAYWGPRTCAIACIWIGLIGFWLCLPMLEFFTFLETTDEWDEDSEALMYCFLLGIIIFVFISVAGECLKDRDDTKAAAAEAQADKGGSVIGAAA
eukprot:TRINITY_DN16045_c0_g2_i1.p1 TRINITY_DN16045_c0_g2~~TRINITY_DN16045_c0_g2_i1.p1  ORF type:complete len:215 (+),score=30.95 TRINITY_DN16045_c0_g2_i1:161-805(+)